MYKKLWCFLYASRLWWISKIDVKTCFKNSGESFDDLDPPDNIIFDVFWWAENELGHWKFIEKEKKDSSTCI